MNRPLAAVAAAWISGALIGAGAWTAAQASPSPPLSCYEDEYAIMVDADNGRCVPADDLYVEDGSPFTFGAVR